MTERWTVTATEDGKDLRLLHPDHGWLTFPLPQDDADAVAESLQFLLRTDAPYEAESRLTAA